MYNSEKHGETERKEGKRDRKIIGKEKEGRKGRGEERNWKN